MRFKLLYTNNAKLTKEPIGQVIGYITKKPSEGNSFMHFYLKNDIRRNK